MIDSEVFIPGGITMEHTNFDAVVNYFKEIAAIPHGSYHEEKISNYLVNFAKEHNLYYEQDEAFNVIMIKEASAGYEDREPIILQGHMDMVCEKETGVKKDMETEGLDLIFDGDSLSAEGTTLGGDDGIFVAYALALLSDETLKHPRLEVIITVSEEVGMLGAQAIDLSSLKGRRLINIDSETEGEFTVGCAGGGTATISLPIQRENLYASGMTFYDVTIDGLLGGHSGQEIDKGRCNGAHALAKVLKKLSSEFSFQLVSFSGGGKDNAIPRYACARIFMDASLKDAFSAALSQKEKALQKEYKENDPGLVLAMSADDLNSPVSSSDSAISETDAAKLPMTKDSTEAVLSLICSLPNGLMEMSKNIPGLVETSLNLGIFHTDDAAQILGISLRSSVSASYDALRARVISISREAGASVSMSGEYPAWEYEEVSPFRDQMVQLYREMYGKAPVVLTIHAGLECGLLSAKLSGLSAISIGPDMKDIHTPGETLSLSSSKRVYEFVRRAIELG